MLIVRKELNLGLRQNMTRATLALMTILFTGIPTAFVYGFRSMDTKQTNMGPLLDIIKHQYPQLANLPQNEMAIAALLTTMQNLFILSPALIPLIMAVYSVIGEKQTRSLEALLATPASTEQILAGKCIAAAVPGILSGWVSYAVFLALSLPALPRSIFDAVLIRPAWLAALLLLVPAIALATVVVGLMVSSRASDPQSAQQVGGLVVLPIVALIGGQASGLVQLSTLVVLLAAVLLLAIDAALLSAAVKLFRRETILTRWK